MAWRIDQTYNSGSDYTLCRHIYHKEQKLKASMLVVAEHSVRRELFAVTCVKPSIAGYRLEGNHAGELRVLWTAVDNKERATSRPNSPN